ncbi:MAG: YIEGIA domain-containing protein [Acetivibrionales bacterium]|jgi:hypothetical protein
MSSNGMLETDMLMNILIATAAGFLSRWSMLRIDFRQYPTFPLAYLIHLTVGFISAFAGSLVIPALLSKDFTAVTFLLLSIQQFREVRKMGKNSLEALETTEYYPRGSAYINGIAKTLEARNYIAMIVSITTMALLVSLPTFLSKFIKTLLSIIAAFIVHKLISNFTKGHTIKDVAEIQAASISIKDNNIYVDDILLGNIGLGSLKDRILEKGLAIVLKPRNINRRIQLNNIGQINAIKHECSRLLGLEGYINSTRDFETGRVAILIIPVRKEIESLIHIIKNVPLLETIKKQANKSGGRDNETKQDTGSNLHG